MRRTSGPAAASCTIDRRSLLKAGGAIVIAFATPVAAAVGPKAPPLTPDQLDSFIAIDRNGICTTFFGKVDLGQGVQMAIAQIVAEELDLPLANVRVVQGDTAVTVDQGGASGSCAISRAGQTLRYAAAEARAWLVERAAAKLGTAASQIETANGQAWVRGTPGRALPYGELIDGYFERQLTWNGRFGNRLEAKGQAQPKPVSEYRIVGTSPPRNDLADNVFGRESFVSDIRLPGMLHARVLRPPVAGASVVRVEPSSIAGLGNARAIHEGGFVVVLAEREWDAIRASRALEIEWSSVSAPFPSQEELYDYLADAPAQDSGGEEERQPEAALDRGRVHEVRYEWPFQSHASIAGACAVADVTGERVTVWTGTQKPHAARQGVATLLQRPVSEVRVIRTRAPGSYGRNDAGDAALEAAYLSRAVGRPVRLQYTRAQATGWDPKSPASIHQCRAVLGDDGSVEAFSFLSRGFSRLNVAPVEADPRDTLIGQMIGLGHNSQPAFSVPEEPYETGATKLGWETVRPFLEVGSPLRTGHLRDPAGLQTNFASESFWDELAHLAQADPVEFRLRHLNDPRGRAALEETARLFGWASRPAGSDIAETEIVRGRGIALGYRSDSICAAAVEIEVNRSTGRIRPVRWAIGHDCGLIINPGTLKLVIEANIIQATSRSLFEEVSYDENAVTSVDWSSYPIADMADVPDSIEIALINRPDLPPGGAGEPASRPVPAALANALFDATGVRLRRAPLTHARVKAALDSTPPSLPAETNASA